jgi:hypothetical protein
MAVENANKSNPIATMYSPYFPRTPDPNALDVSSAECIKDFPLTVIDESFISPLSISRDHSNNLSFL